MAIKPHFKLSEFIRQYLCEFVVCDLVNCELPEVPHCEDGQMVVLKNPGECQPIHECGMTFDVFSVIFKRHRLTWRESAREKIRERPHR